MDNDNLEGLGPPYRPISPQPGCSQHFDLIDEVNTIADNILNAINMLLGSINHTSIVGAIQRNLNNGNNKLSLQDLLPNDIMKPLEINRKRGNSEDISGINMKKPRGNDYPSTPVLAGFLAGNPVNISKFSMVPLRLTPQNSREINNAAVVIDLSTSIETVAKPQIATGSSRADTTLTSADNCGPMQVIELPPENQVQLNLSRPSMGKKVCEEIYRKLRAMFPNIDREYIKHFCPVDWLPGMSHEVQFGTIVEGILANEGSWVMDITNPIDFQAEVPKDDGLTPNIDDIYERLMGIFPNADPHYIRTAAERFQNENDIQSFVDEKLNTNDFPTREQRLARIRVTEEQQRYTKNFNVEQFLSLYPDPFKHFEDFKRKCIHNWIILEFLKRQFNRVRVNTINRVYRSCGYNMSLTAMNLRLSTDYIGIARRHNEIPTENISLLQEMAFVRHHEEIRKHMETVKQREEEEFNSLKAAGRLCSCECCYDEECMPSKCSTCDNGHVFCNSCVINGTDSKLGDGETHVPCFANCESEFSISTLRKVLPPTKFSILLKKRQAAEVMAAGLEGLVSCPFCHFATIPPEGDKVFKCLNPECMKESCIQCKEPNHVPYACGELTKNDLARKYIEEKMTQALTRICYNCKRVFFKEEGCNKMRCPCGAKMCYICNQPVKDYKHFRGQGSTEMDKCPLWSDSIRLNAETVRKVEEDARKKMLRQNPTLDIDTTRLAPALPRPIAGPHRDLEGTENLALNRIPASG